MNRYRLGILLTVGWTLLCCGILAFSGLIDPAAKNVMLTAGLTSAIPVAIYWLFLLSKFFDGFSLVTLFSSLLCALPVGAIVGLSALAVQHNRGSGVLHAAGLDAHLKEYLVSPMGLHGNPATSFPGKTVIVDLGDRDFSELQFRLPHECMPTSADEVRWIAQVKYRLQVVGHYSNSHGDASQWHMNVRIIDRQSKQCVLQTDFVGSEPPVVVKGSNGASGSKPGDELISLLAQRTPAP